MDETLPTAWPDITTLAVAGNKWWTPRAAKRGLTNFFRS
jgi:hypothetical protein